MSIYSTHWIMKIEVGTDDWRDVWFQIVPGHIRHVGPEWAWLPPPSQDANAPRAIFICDDFSEKGTPRNDQEYVNPILMLTPDEYEKIGWRELMSRIYAALLRRADSEKKTEILQARQRAEYERLKAKFEHKE